MLFVMTLTTFISDVKPLLDYVKDFFLPKINSNKNKPLVFPWLMRSLENEWRLITSQMMRGSNPFDVKRWKEKVYSCSESCKVNMVFGFITNSCQILWVSQKEQNMRVEGSQFWFLSVTAWISSGPSPTYNLFLATHLYINDTILFCTDDSAIEILQHPPLCIASFSF